MDAPVVGAINGTAAGGGFSLSLTTDIAIAAESAKFTMAYTQSYNIAVLNIGDRKTHNFMMFRNTSRIIDEGLRHVQHERP